MQKEGPYMSLGYEGVCKLVDQDDEIAIYVYIGADIDCKTQIAYRFDLDGVITIYKRCLEEPEIHTRIKRRPSGKKYESIKRITHIPDISKHLNNGDVIIEKECKNACRRGNMKTDYIAYRLLMKIFIYYQENGILPEHEMFMQ